MKVVLPFPPSELSGHNNGHWRSRDRIVASWRSEAFHAARDAKLASRFQPPATGDIILSITLVPPNDRGDRVNYPIRLKPQIDGIAEAIGVNDKRFLPSYVFCEPEKPGRVEYTLIYPQHQGEQGENRFTDNADSAKKVGPGECANTRSGSMPQTLSRSA